MCISPSLPPSLSLSLSLSPVLAQRSHKDAEALASESEYTDEFEFFEEDSIDEEIAAAREARAEA